MYDWITITTAAFILLCTHGAAFELGRAHAFKTATRLLREHIERLLRGERQ